MKGNTAFVNEFSLSEEILGTFEKHEVITSVTVNKSVPGGAREVMNLISEPEVSLLKNELNEVNWVPVGIDGILSHYSTGQKIGSYRASCYEERWAQVMFERLRHRLPEVWSFNGLTTENEPFSKWKFVGVNPLFRFIKYEEGGSLIPHYDRAFTTSRTRTLASLVLYLTDTDVGSGRTRFINDFLKDIPVSERNLADWRRFASADEANFIPESKAGDALIFDHCVLHDSESHKGVDPKIIARTDLVFKPIA